MSNRKNIAEKNAALAVERKRKRAMSVLGAVVVLITVIALMVPAIAMTRGALVCGMEEHKHSDACYEQVLVCTQEEGESHQHGTSCYKNKLTCDKPVHTHSDSCYETTSVSTAADDLSEGQDSGAGTTSADGTTTNDASATNDNADANGNVPSVISAAGASGDASKSSDADSSASADSSAGASAAGADAADMPERVFDGYLKDADDKIVLAVTVEAPEGAFPVNTTMKIDGVAADKVRDKVAKAVKDAKGEAFEVKQLTTIDIVFEDADGNEIEPAEDVQVKIQANEVRDYKDPLLVHVLDKSKESSKGKKVDAEVVDKVKIVNWSEDDKTTGNEDTMQFKTRAFSPYVIVEVEEVDANKADADAAKAAADADMPAQSFKGELKDKDDNVVMTVSVEAPAGALPKDATMVIAAVEPQDVESAIEDAVAKKTDGKVSSIQAVDISFRDADNKEIEPAKKITVSLASSVIAQTDDPLVVHVDDKGKADVVDTLDADALQEHGLPIVSDELVFDSDEFSVYAVVEVTIETNVLTSDGRNYKITVTYGPEARVPEGAKLQAEEIVQREGASGEANEYDAYVEKTREVLGVESDAFEYARFFDIKIVDKDDAKVDIAAPVDVKIDLADKDASKDAEDNTQVVHFADGADTGDVVAGLSVDGETVSFAADGFSVYAVVTVDPTNMDGRTYGLIQTKDGTNPSGIAMMSTAQSNGTKLQGKSTTVRVDTVSRTDYVYVAKDSNITMWTFHEATGGKYYITTQAGDVTKYLKVSTGGVSLVDTPDEDCTFAISEGTGTYAGKYKLSTANGVLRLNGSNFERAKVSFGDADAWMNFAQLSDLNESDFVTYTAQKVSISEKANEVINGDPVILYTRIWNDVAHKYDYYAVDYDGKLVKAYESGDTISWVGSQVNTMLWDFTEYYFPGTDTPNGYYELKNQHSDSDKYIAPKTSDGSETFLSNSPIGINLNGRGENEYYTTILAWDGYYYASLKADEDNIKLLSSTISQASDFYFAKMSTDTSTMEVTTVSTVDSTQYGITLKMQDFGGNDTLTDGRSEEMDDILGATKYEQWTGTKNLLQSYIAEDGTYPVAKHSNKTLDKLFSNPMEVNQQFLTSTYYETGYFEYDSTRNFAHLITSKKDPWYGLEAPNGTNYDVGDFVIYGQLGTSSEGDKPTLRHGQFLPYNDIISGFETDAEGNLITDDNGNPIPIPIKISKKYQNTMDIHADPLSSLDPAYGEALYEIQWNNTHRLPYVDHFFGMEMSASFMQSASGVDAWGHDLIFEFSGDDDFWLYVDDVLVLDLGGIHSALDGNINFRTGQIVENGTSYTLRQRFADAYKAQHPNATEQDVQDWLKGIFKVEKVIVDGEEQEEPTDVFKDYSSHTMRMFYLERGAGASNIHMRFNLSEYKEGRVQLEKIVSGTENSDELFPFQIWYKNDDGQYVRANNNIPVKDAQTNDPVTYSPEYKVSLQGGDTMTYEDVFFLRAGQAANIDLPHENTEYYIRECAMVSPDTYDWVKINDVETAGIKVAPQKYNDQDVTDGQHIQDENRRDFKTTEAPVSERKKVIYENHVNESAMKSLTITKRLWQDEARTTAIHSGTGADANNTEFAYRVYIGMEDGTYTLYKNGPYRVKNPEGEYCYFHDNRFESTGKKVFSEITDDLVDDPEILQGDTLQQRCTFHTGRGSISRIKADYTVEIPGLMNGTPFIVLERDGEVPSGYNRLGYTVTESGELVNETLEQSKTEDEETSDLIYGTIDSDQDIFVHNQHGYSLNAKKVWSDAAFMDDHDEIYFAVYKKNENALELIQGSVRQLGKTSTSLSWFFPKLDEGKTLNDYVVYEVELKVPKGSELDTVTVDPAGKVIGYTTVASGVVTSHTISEDTIVRIEEGGILTAGGTSNEQGYSASMKYVAGYSRQELEPGTNGNYPNTRTDTVTNSRPGIKIVKTDMSEEHHPLEGAIFELSRSADGGNEGQATAKTFTSDSNGLVAVAYLLPETEYTLKELSAPYGFQTLIDRDQVKIKVGADGKLYVNGSTDKPENDSYAITQEANPTATNMPTVEIHNKDLSVKAVKIDSYTGSPMQGVKFALYKEVYAASTGGLHDPNRPMPNYTPMEGYEELVTDAKGVIPKIVLKNSAESDGLEPGNYYLREVETPSGYIAPGFYIRIMISPTGEVTLQKAVRPTQEGQNWQISAISSDDAEKVLGDDGLLQIKVKNTPKDPIRIKKVDMDSGKVLKGVTFKLYRANQVEDGKPLDDAVPVVEGSTDQNGILNLGGLDGLYFLFETETLPGYMLLSGPVTINASAENNTITASLNGPLKCEHVKDDNNKDVWEITVKNSTGTALPTTGGPGTTPLYTVGLLMIATSVVMFIRLYARRRPAWY